MNLIKQTVALILWVLLYVPTSVFVILVMIKELWTYGRSKNATRPANPPTRA